MLILSKKRMGFILSFVFISLLAVSLKSINETNLVNDTIEATSTPVSNKIVILDAGHGLPDEGVSLLH